ncbi:F-box/kelch-repeat protein, partial [Clarias magur]
MAHRCVFVLVTEPSSCARGLNSAPHASGARRKAPDSTLLRASTATHGHLGSVKLCFAPLQRCTHLQAETFQDDRCASK